MLISESEDDDKDEEKEEEEEETKLEESESKESENEDESLESQRNTLQKPKKKKHVGRLAALRKGNYLLKALVDRLKDDLVKQRENSPTLQEDFDSVLAELS